MQSIRRTEVLPTQALSPPFPLVDSSHQMSKLVDTPYEFPCLEHCNDIRLIYVHRGRFSPFYPDKGLEVSIEIKIARWDQKPCYTTLSYAWGDGPPVRNLEVTGPHSGTIKISQHLYDFLRQWNKRQSELEALWVDALCTYFDRYKTEHLGNLRFRPLFSKEFRFASRIKFIALNPPSRRLT